MPLGFYLIMAAQFFSSLADNALLVAAISLLMQMHADPWMPPLPVIPGIEMAGTVAELGSGSTRFKVGQKVYGK